LVNTSFLEDSENKMAAQTLYARHEFFFRRLHSITGVFPVGAFMLMHLTINASLLSAPSTFQKNLYQIHSLESLLPIVEWLFILLPILFHGILGVVIIRSGQANTGMYPFAANIRYTLQRATGIIAFAFIVWHVFHMHGWFHFDAWTEHVTKPLHGARFRAFNAASTLGIAMNNGFVLALYAVGVMSCVYHFANGLWTMGITWGLWTSVGAQRRALQLCAGFGVALAILVVGVLYGTATVDIRAAKDTEDRMYESLVNSKEIRPNPEKRSEATEAGAQRGGAHAAALAGAGTP
jgi:succinate dehydrogenase / fumarate reductase cytochrome b subunit